MKAAYGKDGVANFADTVIEALRIWPPIMDKCKVAIYKYSDFLTCLAPLQDMNSYVHREDLYIDFEGLANWGNMFTSIYAVIETDVARLKKEGYRIPALTVFILSSSILEDQFAEYVSSLKHAVSTRPVPKYILCSPNDKASKELKILWQEIEEIVRESPLSLRRRRPQFLELAQESMLHVKIRDAVFDQIDFDLGPTD